MESPSDFRIMLEVGSKWVFASALDWPGWSRSGRDEAQAIETLFNYAHRYARAISASGIPFQEPVSIMDFAIIERVSGNTTTDFGAPNIPAKVDSDVLDESELEQLQAILVACWQYLDTVALDAQTRELRKGPRGGGRNLEKIIAHVQEAEAGYLRALGVDRASLAPSPMVSGLSLPRQEILAGIELSARGEIPAIGPRGAARWKPRTFIRRVAWHALDHAWEIEDRLDDK